jgi:FemAB-related protein (PEP-CTERM system-associated)
MPVDIRIVKGNEAPAWDAYVQSHPYATLYHLHAWQRVIQETYNHKAYYFLAFERGLKLQHAADRCIGILPLVHLKSTMFGSHLISMPFFDIGGVLADDAKTEQALVGEAVLLGNSLAVDSLELRHRHPSSFVGSRPSYMHKVRMLLDLPESAEVLMKSFKSKLRSQIKKAMKEGLKSEIGGLELLDCFYSVFLVNMRDLGSPVHSKRLMENVLKHFPDKARVIVVRHSSRAIAGSMVVGFKEVLENPWASSLRQFSHLNPNMLLYWTMLEYACHQGYRKFDFGRSTPGEGTFKFKEQWGAKPEPLHWQYIPIKREGSEPGDLRKSLLMARAERTWKRLPVAFTRIIGPSIRKYINL